MRITSERGSEHIVCKCRPGVRGGMGEILSAAAADGAEEVAKGRCATTHLGSQRRGRHE